MYWWEGKIEEGDEWVAILKTVEENFEEVKTELEKIHPHEIPAIFKIKVEGNEKYVDWLNSVMM